MRLTAYSDYALRTLIYLAMHRKHLVTIQDIAEANGIAKNHLSKVVHQLSTLGYIDTTRGRNGGLQLGHEPEAIRIGAVVRHTETDFDMAPCFAAEPSGCMYDAGCGLKGALSRATRAFLAELDAVTLDQVVPGARRKKAGAASVTQIVQLPTKRPAGRKPQ
jgi:Rrf2 family nitric oxide-sensitive transcriptional repressor